ncbi:MAG: DUF262 domain-containing protein [Candidatus Kapabacteria bacterium]|nr:DUF262 domain-containing protein [Candidatus Kapabacteria bacterium]
MAINQNGHNIIPPEQVEKAEEQLRTLQRQYDYDTKDYPLRYIMQLFEEDELFVPEYQRELKWSEKFRVSFIESLLLGIPIAPLLIAQLDDGRLEIIDGTQRTRTLLEFFKNRLCLSELEKLTEFAGFYFKDFSLSRQRKFAEETLRVQVIYDETDESIRSDIFNRVNTQSLPLTSNERRRGAFPGPFTDFVVLSASDERFTALCPVSEKRGKDEHQELCLRFFAYSENYTDFEHDVAPFLDEYVQQENQQFDEQNQAKKSQNFEKMIVFVNQYFPHGFAKSAKSKATPRVRFEAISVGSHLALQENSETIPQYMDWLESDEFIEFTTSDASNNQGKLKRRVEFVRDCLLNRITKDDLNYTRISQRL